MQPISTPSPFIALPKEGLQQPTATQQQARLKGQVEEFASLLYAEMFQEMREAGKSDDDQESSVFGGGDTDVFMHFLDEAVGRNFIQQGGSGLSDALYKQLSKPLEEQAQGGGQ